MGEDILSVIFLVLVCIVISSIAYRLAPGQMQMPTFALIAVCLWIALDFILMKRHKAITACSTQHSTDAEIDDKINKLTNELSIVDTSDINDNTAPKTHIPETPTAQHKNEFDIALFDKELSIQELYKDMGCSGDTKIANRMKYMGLQDRMAHDIRAKWNVEKLRPYFVEELEENENRDWWETDAAYLDNLM